MEFACKLAGTKLIVVMVHQHFGAVRRLIEDVHLSNIKSRLFNFKPAVAMSCLFILEKLSKNETYVKDVVLNNLRITLFFNHKRK